MSINIYHCPCTTRILATTQNLETLPRRQVPGLDQAIIYPLSYGDTLNEVSNLVSDDPQITRREDGFESRIFHRCVRCRNIIAYELANRPGREPVIYILPGWLQTTEAIRRGRGIDARNTILGQGPTPAAFT